MAEWVGPVEAGCRYDQLREKEVCDDDLKLIDQLKVEQDYITKFDDNPSQLAGGFDKFAWNLYRALLPVYKERNLGWRQARKHAVLLLANLNRPRNLQISGDDAEADSIDEVYSHVSFLEELQAMAGKKLISEIRVKPPFKIEVVDKEGKIIELNGINFVNEANAVTSQAEADLAKIQQELSEVELSELPVKRLNRSRYEDVSLLEGIRKTEKAPYIIEEQFRHKFMCATYAIFVLGQEFGGVDAIKKMNLWNGGKLQHAWNAKPKLLKSGFLNQNIHINGTSFQGGKLHIVDPDAYYSSIAKMYEKFDKQGGRPALIGLYHNSTAYSAEIANANRSRSPREQSYNSHLAVLVGREEPRSKEVNSESSLANFIESNFGIPANLQSNLQIEVLKSGSVSMTKMEENLNYKLKAGDIVKIRDILVTDFVKTERVYRLADYIKKTGSNVMVDYYDFKHTYLPDTLEFDLKPKSFIQIPNGQQIHTYAKAQLGLSDQDWNYYVAAWEMLGKPIERIRHTDILPTYNLSELKVELDNLGGPAKVRRDLLAKDIEKYNSKSEKDFFVLIEPLQNGQRPIDAFMPFFAKYFNGRHKLNIADENLLMDLLSKSLKNVELPSGKNDASKMRFEAGDKIYLTHKRIEDIARLIYEQQAQSFSDSDYVSLIDKGDLNPYEFIKSSFDKFAESNKIVIKYADLDSVERDLLVRVLDACSPDVDLSLVKNGKVTNWKSFEAGKRLIFKQNDMRVVIEKILAKRKSQELVMPSKLYYRKLGADLKEGEKFGSAVEFVDVPQNLQLLVNDIYPGNNLQESVIRNSLLLVWLGEQGRGSNRAFAKAIAEEFRLTESVGLMQIRPTKEDFEICAKKFSELGISVPDKNDPERLNKFKDQLMDDERLSVVVAGERLRHSLETFTSIMKANQENVNEQILKPEFVRTLLTSYNRSNARVLDTVYQNWSYNLTTLTEYTQTKFDVNKIDATYISSEDKKQNRETVKIIFANAMKLAGVKDDDAKKDLELMFADRGKFLESNSFRALQAYYKMQKGENLTFVFNENELERGDKIFDYGAKLDPQMTQWVNLYNDHSGLAKFVKESKSEYTPLPVEPTDIEKVFEKPTPSLHQT